ncbi:hypothetical protein PF005_g6231 [Phytophthora fragariae]|uniref:Secreted protein n=1 Tax=Phytophthora fragariae TaxID=53985 RepID=A0A6A3YS12_9STRA|nr:hypothetical protein PF003_g24032 [Phytophthora fragariae]KAE8942914.1 hypothetical protein PF009_g7339 [Phytophthora fragariae]KAE9020673.1 hypothetical protein PF011_g5297 [Phytophthora fragariae]KAE9125306.1 hypothetical protein PF010_g5683 [Phytophthora fragariae]KAE9127503.1 hypothetical protein PF007_g5594 [Phytophthora fragariae]
MMFRAILFEGLVMTWAVCVIARDRRDGWTNDSFVNICVGHEHRDQTAWAAKNTSFWTTFPVILTKMGAPRSWRS